MSEIFVPLEDKVLVRLIKSTAIETTEAGIITDTIKKLTRNGEVVAVGAGRYAMESGVFMPNVLHEGDVVIFGDSIGLEIKVNGEDLLLMREGDILLASPKKQD
jgi:chaperonin GroES